MTILDTAPKGMIAGGLLSWAADRFRDRVALTCPDRDWRYIDLEVASNRFANALIGLGLPTGTRVAVLMENSAHAVICPFGIEKAGLAYVALNARHALPEQLDILNDCGARVLVVSEAFFAVADEIQRAVGADLLVIRYGDQSGDPMSYASLVDAARDRAPAVTVPMTGVQRIAYTSGTTGKPKGVVYSWGRLRTQLNNNFMAMEYALGVSDATLHLGPLTHASGVQLLPSYLRGARNVVPGSFDVERTLNVIAEQRITQMLVVPTMLRRLLEALDADPKADMSSLVRLNYGTASTPAAMIEAALERFGPILRQQYGMTEAIQPLSILYPHEHLDKGMPSPRIQSCGKPAANVGIALHGSDDQPVAKGEVGEIVIAHDGIGEVRFWNRPELEAQTIRGGWYYTGDLGRIDDDGYLYIVGRNKDMIISGGFNVYALEVEDALRSNPAVYDCAVVGLPSAEWGESVAAFIVAAPGEMPTTEAIRAHCKTLISGYKCPRLVQVVEDLPRNAAGKVLKDRLRASFLEEHGAE
ncbi:MAG TPA: hypothetical protein DEF12_02565 [Rhodobacteraceae bacterium]|jgi:acyl-CoA synthetase (AMP-forming)/AMP-acid ligase II|nr:hypothetical protein [Paracoccaceae bacterium]